MPSTLVNEFTLPLILVMLGLAVAGAIVYNSYATEKQLLANAPTGRADNITLSDVKITAKEVQTFTRTEYVDERAGTLGDVSYKVYLYELSWENVEVEAKDGKNVDLYPVLHFEGRTYYNPSQVISLNGGKSGPVKVEFTMQFSIEDIYGTTGIGGGILAFFRKSPCMPRAFENDNGIDDSGSGPGVDAVYYGLAPDIEITGSARIFGLLRRLTMVDLILQCSGDFVGSKNFEAKAENTKVIE